MKATVRSLLAGLLVTIFWVLAVGIGCRGGRQMHGALRPEYQRLYCGFQSVLRNLEN